MAKISRLEILAEMGFANDPFRKAKIQSSDFLMAGKVANMAIRSRAMISVVGERGIGKTNAVRNALQNSRNVRRVHIHANDINKLLISDIEQALIFDLSDEKPKRGREIRARQLRRILGEASRRMDIVLIIEEGHHLHGMTLRAIKRLREMEWMGESELFSIILICQSDPMCKPGVSEVRLRSDSIQMKGMSTEEIKAFVKQTVGPVFEKEVVEAITELPNSHNYEDLKSILIKLMEEALFAGRKKVTIDDVENGFEIGNLEEMRKRVGISKAELSRKSGISALTVSKLLTSENVQHLSPSSQNKS
ncbi:MAG: AAA family ATPase, partial [Desulfobacteraceae bacterium]|nr:AAA family ATPase [Desulfobacteraceae bacterium]